MHKAHQVRPGSDSHWIKSSLSYSNSNCVEVADLPDGQIGVRHSKDREGPVLSFTSDEWHAFLGGVQKGEFDSFGRKLLRRAECRSTPLWPNCRLEPRRRPLPTTEGPSSFAMWQWIAARRDASSAHSGRPPVQMALCQRPLA